MGRKGLDPCLNCGQAFGSSPQELAGGGTDLVGRNGIGESAVNFGGAIQGLGIPCLRDLILALLFKAEQQFVRKLGSLLHWQMQGDLFKCFGVHGFSFTTTVMPHSARCEYATPVPERSASPVPRSDFLEVFLAIFVVDVFNRCSTKVTAEIERPALRCNLLERRGCAQARVRVAVRQPLVLRAHLRTH